MGNQTTLCFEGREPYVSHRCIRCRLLEGTAGAAYLAVGVLGLVTLFDDQVADWLRLFLGFVGVCSLFLGLVFLWDAVANEPHRT